MIHSDILVSIIIPIYNTEKYLERCLRSVTAIQNRKIEIIIVDDGSTDMSPIIYEKYAREDNRINIIRKENGGVSSARNLGIQMAMGEWISFIDSDDEIIPEVYDAFILQLNNASEMWILGMALRYMQAPHPTRKNIQGIWFEEDIEIFRKSIFHQDMKWARRVRRQGFYLKGPWAKFYQKRIILSNNIWFPEDLVIGEDCVFNFLYLYYVKSISYKNQCAYYYWQNDNSVMHKFKKGKGKQYLLAAERILDLLGKGYLPEYAQYGVRCYLNAMKTEWCHTSNHDSYFIRRREALEWREKWFIQKAFQNCKLLQIRWEAIPVAFCAKMKWFLLCDILLKTKEKLPIRFR